LRPSRAPTALFHGHSYAGNPIACAAARASLALLDDACAARRESIERVHREGTQRLATLPKVRSPRVLGTVAALDIEGPGSYLDPIGPKLAAFAFREGVLLRPLGNVVYLLPPYCASDADLVRTYDVIYQFLTT
jgi:adenosylmethionine---8-amino-7-oxononanoate aminotransferase